MTASDFIVVTFNDGHREVHDALDARAVVERLRNVVSYTRLAEAELQAYRHDGTLPER